MAFSSDTRTVKSSTTRQSADSIENARLEGKLKQEQLKRAIQEAKNGSSGSGSSGATGLSQDQRDAADRDYRSKEGDKAFDRQRILADDRRKMDAEAAADQTANIIRQRQEASSRGLRVGNALARARR
jgi:hypothetical protein